MLLFEKNQFLILDSFSFFYGSLVSIEWILSSKIISDYFEAKHQDTQKLTKPSYCPIYL